MSKEAETMTEIERAAARLRIAAKDFARLDAEVAKVLRGKAFGSPHGDGKRLDEATRRAERAQEELERAAVEWTKALVEARGLPDFPANR